MGALPHRQPPDPVEEPERACRALALPMALAAFFLGVVVAGVALLSVQTTRGDTVPATTHQGTLVQLAAEQAARAAADELAAAQADALADADGLARRLVAALDSPPVSAADLAALRREVTRQSTTIRERVRVVRVPVPGPTVTAQPARPAPARPEAVRPTPAPPTPAPEAACVVGVLGMCLTR